MSHGEPSPFTVGMAKTILEQDPNPLRFERWCVDLFSLVDRTDYVPTSRTYDKGRDGRTVNLGHGSVPAFILCTVGDKLPQKVQSDLRTLLTTVNPKVIRVCTARLLSEAEIERTKSVVREQCKGLESVDVDGLEQLAVLAHRYPTTLQAHYGAELKALRDSLSYEGDDESAIQLSGMRLALSTQLTGDAAALRRRALHGILIDALAARSPVDPARLPNYVRERLRLPGPVQMGYLRTAIEELKVSGHITERDGRLALTDRGRATLADRNREGGRLLLEGRTLVRAELERLTGQHLPDDKFATIWDLLEAGIADMFLVNGLQVVQAVSSLLNQPNQSAPETPLRALIDRLADKIDFSLASWPPGADFSQATRDIFLDQSSPAFSWFAGLATVYLVVCSLGLEPSAQEQVESRLRHIHLLLDTDVVLSYLCRAEPSHGAIRDIITAWHRLRGKLCVTESVLTEAAYHAWIADVEFGQVWKELETLDYHVLSTAFVRTFKMLGAGRLTPANWQRYIGQYKGSHSRDYQPIWEELRDEAKCEMASEDAGNQEFAEAVEKQLFSHKESKLYAREEYGREVHAKERDKCKRDGRLIAFLTRQRELQRRATSETTIVVSSSTSLRWVCSLYREKLGAPDPVLSVSAIAYVLSLVPGVALTVRNLRSVLFDSGMKEKLSAWDTTALRALYVSEEYDPAWSSRIRLKREIDDALLKQARERGEPVRKVRERMESMTEEGTQLSAEVLASAIDKLVGSKSERRIAELREALRRERGG